MQDSTLANRYAIALADLASEQELLGQVEEEVQGFTAVLAATPEFRQLLESPTVKTADQHAALGTYLKQSKSSKMVGNFLKLLIDKGRMTLADGISTALSRVVEERSGRLTVQVQTPRALTKDHKKKLQAALSQATEKEVSLDVKEEAGLLGGIVVQIGSQMLDYSVRGRLNRLKVHLKG